MANFDSPDHSEYLFKVLVIGELGVGKTSLIRRYVHQLFSQHYRATIGVDFALKVIHLDSKTLVRMQLWDIAATLVRCLSGSAMASAERSEGREHLFKVLVIGDLGVGKTSIIKRYVHQFFSQHYRATIGVDFALKVIHWDRGTLVRLQLWDIAGQERFGNMTRVYYKEAVGAFVVFDVTRGSTFEAVSKWKHDLDSKVHLPNGGSIPAILLANKCDQNKETSRQTLSHLDQFCKESGFVGWFETSAKDNINIDEAARSLIEHILSNYKSFPAEENDVDTIKLDQAVMHAESKSQCC